MGTFLDAKRIGSTRPGTLSRGRWIIMNLDENHKPHCLHNCLHTVLRLTAEPNPKSSAEFPTIATISSI
jgi:hypothetical protein